MNWQKWKEVLQHDKISPQPFTGEIILEKEGFFHRLPFHTNKKEKHPKYCTFSQMTLYLMSNDIIMTRVLKTIFGKRKLDSRIDFINLSREGISMSIFRKILEYTSLTTKEISENLPISERQLVRYKEDHILRKDISSHLIQLVELFERGYEVFSEDKFRKWIRSEVKALGNNKPIELLDTPIGIQMVTDILGRIEHGVYS